MIPGCAIPGLTECIFEAHVDCELEVDINEILEAEIIDVELTLEVCE